MKSDYRLVLFGLYADFTRGGLACFCAPGTSERAFFGASLKHFRFAVIVGDYSRFPGHAC
jgi:hypothetical protein